MSQNQFLWDFDLLILWLKILWEKLIAPLLDVFPLPFLLNYGPGGTLSGYSGNLSVLINIDNDIGIISRNMYSTWNNYDLASKYLNFILLSQFLCFRYFKSLPSRRDISLRRGQRWDEAWKELTHLTYQSQKAPNQKTWVSTCSIPSISSKIVWTHPALTNCK